MRTCVSCASVITKSGQVIFRVKDDRGPLITIHSTCGGNQRTKSEFYVTQEALADLAHCFAEAAKYDYESKLHYNQGESPSSLMQGDIDDYGDITPFGMTGGDGTVQGIPTLTDRGYRKSATLTIDDCSYPGMSIVPGTAKGTVYRLGKEVQRFTVLENGKMVLEKVDTPTIYLVQGLLTRSIALPRWSGMICLEKIT